MRRILVIGTTGSGKTTLAREAAARLGVPHGEQDAWQWLPDWQEAPLEAFRAEVDRFTAQGAWVMDGNYTKAQDIGWSRADTLVWLDYPAPLVLGRLLRRTARRVLSREELWNGNRERLRAALSRDSLIVWFFRTHWRRRRLMPARLARHPHLRVLRLRSPAQARAWLAGLAPTETGGA